MLTASLRDEAARVAAPAKRIPSDELHLLTHRHPGSRPEVDELALDSGLDLAHSLKIEVRTVEDIPMGTAAALRRRRVPC